MNLKFTAENVDDMDFRVEISMTLGEWKRFGAQIDSAALSWPTSEVIRSIRSMVNKAEKNYYPDQDPA